MKILGIIPARGGSKGIKKKNIIDCGGKPLIYWSIQTGLELVRNNIIERCIVSSDCDEIIKVAKNYEADVPFKRDAKIAKDKSKAIEYVLDTINRLKLLNETYEAVLILQPTCPIRDIVDITEAIKLFTLSNSNSLISCYQEEYITNAVIYYAKGNKLEPICDSHNQGINRQEHKPMMIRNGSIYITKTDYLMKNKCLISNNPMYYKMNKINSINIDCKEDLDLARRIL